MSRKTMIISIEDALTKKDRCSECGAVIPMVTLRLDNNCCPSMCSGEFCCDGCYLDHLFGDRCEDPDHQ